MEPHGHIAHYRKAYIEFYVKAYVLFVPMWFKLRIAQSQ